MPLRCLSLLSALLLLGACDWVSARVADGGAAAAPEGWESIEDEDSALRLYYQFIDEKRQVRFVERLDEVPEPLRAGVGFVKMAVPPPLSPGDAARSRAAAASQRPTPTRVATRSAAGSGIVLYSAEWCAACKKAKRFLDRNGVSYEVRDIDEPRHAEALLELTGRRAVPVIDVGGRVLTGFSAQAYERLIDRA